MTLSDEDRRRIEEEEYRKLARERLEAGTVIVNGKRLEPPNLKAGTTFYPQVKVQAKRLAWESYGFMRAMCSDAATPIVCLVLGVIVVFVVWFFDIPYSDTAQEKLLNKTVLPLWALAVLLGIAIGVKAASRQLLKNEYISRSADEVLRWLVDHITICAMLIVLLVSMQVAVEIYRHG